MEEQRDHLAGGDRREHRGPIDTVFLCRVRQAEDDHDRRDDRIEGRDEDDHGRAQLSAEKGSHGEFRYSILLFGFDELGDSSTPRRTRRVMNTMTKLRRNGIRHPQVRSCSSGNAPTGMKIKVARIEPVAAPLRSQLV